MEFGVRLNDSLYYNFHIDLDSGDILVREIVRFDGPTVVEHTGHVVWEDGE